MLIVNGRPWVIPQILGVQSTLSEELPVLRVKTAMVPVDSEDKENTHLGRSDAQIPIHLDSRHYDDAQKMGRFGPEAVAIKLGSISGEHGDIYQDTDFEQDFLLERHKDMEGGQDFDEEYNPRNIGGRTRRHTSELQFQRNQPPGHRPQPPFIGRPPSNQRPGPHPAPNGGRPPQWAPGSPHPGNPGQRQPNNFRPQPHGPPPPNRHQRPPIGPPPPHRQPPFTSQRFPPPRPGPVPNHAQTSKLGPPGHPINRLPPPPNSHLGPPRLTAPRPRQLLPPRPGQPPNRSPPPPNSHLGPPRLTAPQPRQLLPPRPGQPPNRLPPPPNSHLGPPRLTAPQPKPFFPPRPGQQPQNRLPPPPNSHLGPPRLIAPRPRQFPQTRPGQPPNRLPPPPNSHFGPPRLIAPRPGQLKPPMARPPANRFPPAPNRIPTQRFGPPHNNQRGPPRPGPPQPPQRFGPPPHRFPPPRSGPPPSKIPTSLTGNNLKAPGPRSSQPIRPPSLVPSRPNIVRPTGLIPPPPRAAPTQLQPVSRPVEKVIPPRIELVKPAAPFSPKATAGVSAVSPDEEARLRKTPWYERRFDDYDKYRQLGIPIGVPPHGPGRPVIA